MVDTEMQSTSTLVVDATLAPFQIFERVIQVRPEDIFGVHVNIASFFAYISSTFNRWYAEIGVADSEGDGSGPHMAHLSYDFLQEMHYPGAVLCRLTVVRVGTSSLEHSIEVRDANHPERLCGRGKSIHVWVDAKAKKATAWPADVLAKIWVPRPA